MAAVTFSCEVPPVQMVLGVAVGVLTAGAMFTVMGSVKGLEEQPAALKAVKM